MTQFSRRSVQSVVSYVKLLTDRQPDRQTNAGHYITSLAEVMKSKVLPEQHSSLGGTVSVATARHQLLLRDYGYKASSASRGASVYSPSFTVLTDTHRDGQAEFSRRWLVAYRNSLSDRSTNQARCTARTLIDSPKPYRSSTKN